MILIADSGSTKTDWCVVEHGQLIQQIFTKGTNPFFQSEEEISNEIATALIPQLKTNKFEAVHFYGAGCAFPDKIETMRKAIASHLQVSGEIEVSTDMLAAARSLCGHQPGIACIMGTGSNSCYYDGKNIVTNVSPLGFILGDEGSGAVLGKLLVGDILKNQMTPGLKEEFLEQFCEQDTTLVGFCVMGGIFSEGIDLTGKKLIGAVIVGTGLPQTGTEREILRQYYDSRGEDGFAYAYRYPGMNKVLQAAGRVIRTQEDTGAILLLDERFRNSEYRPLFPVEWNDRENCSLNTVQEKLKQFWEKAEDVSGK